MCGRLRATLSFIILDVLPTDLSVSHLWILVKRATESSVLKKLYGKNRKQFMGDTSGPAVWQPGGSSGSVRGE